MAEEHRWTEIEDGIYQVQLPLPFALRIVNCYLLRGKDGWTIVDTGIHTPEGEAAWHEVFAGLKINITDIRQIVMTHVHPDHFGMAGWLQSLAAEHGYHLPVKTSPREDETVKEFWRRIYSREDFAAWLRDNGMPAEMAASVEKRMGDTRRMTLPHPSAIEHIYPGDTIRMGERDYRMIHAPGHSDGQLIFYDESDKLLLSGDHVLLKITPNIGLWEKSDPNPLGMFLESLSDLKNLPVRLALPGHKALITDWRGRIEELLHHHELRLNHVMETLENGAATPYDISLKIFETERFSPHEWRFALAETLAHIEYLRVQGKVAVAENGAIRHFRLI